MRATTTLTVALLWGAVLALVIDGRAVAQTGPSEAVKSMIGGGWEMSNADRDKTCIINFRLDTAGPGRVIDMDKNCASNFPMLKDVVAWTIGGKDEALRLIDAKANVILEFNEVENGLFESAHASDSLYFLQTVAAAEGRERTADQMFGNWAFARNTGKPLCQIQLMDAAADTDNFALRVKDSCDALVASFAPKSWRMDHGHLLVISAKGEFWRFEESEQPTTWRRIPEGRQPLLLVRQVN